MSLQYVYNRGLLLSGISSLVLDVTLVKGVAALMDVINSGIELAVFPVTDMMCEVQNDRLIMRPIQKTSSNLE